MARLRGEGSRELFGGDLWACNGRVCGNWMRLEFVWLCVVVRDDCISEKVNFIFLISCYIEVKI